MFTDYFEIKNKNFILMNFSVMINVNVVRIKLKFIKEN